MDDVLRVDVLHPVHQLLHVVAGLDLGDHVAGLEHVHQGPFGAVLQHDVDVVRVLKVLDELHHVLVDQVSEKLKYARIVIYRIIL